MYRLFFLLLACISASSSNSDDFFSDKERGWFFYEEPVLEEKKKEDVIKPIPNKGGGGFGQMSAREILKKQGEDWENSLSEAILDPTPENYRRYLAQTAAIQKQGQDFSLGFKRAIWVNPEYDYSLESPRNTQAIIAHNEVKNRNADAGLRSLSKDNGILFFFRSDCPYCHRYAPILKRFAETYGFTVVPVSLDGQGISEYPYPKTNYDAGRKLKVSAVPATFLINPDSNTVGVVGYGFSDWSELTQKISFAGQKMNKKNIVGK
jgi:conjugal transfer pilus assembly protein TraF